MEDLITFLVKVLANFLLVIFAIFSSDPEQILTPNNSTLSEFTVSFYDMSMMNWLMFQLFQQYGRGHFVDSYWEAFKDESKSFHFHHGNLVLPMFNHQHFLLVSQTGEVRVYYYGCNS